MQRKYDEIVEYELNFLTWQLINSIVLNYETLLCTSHGKFWSAYNFHTIIMNWYTVGTLHKKLGHCLQKGYVITFFLKIRL